MISPAEHRIVDPEYFSLRARRAMRESPEADDQDDLLDESEELELAGELPAESELLMEHPEVIEAGAEVADAETAVLRAEDSGFPDQVAMRRLDRARAEERAVMVRMQKARTVAHTERVESRAAQVVAMHPRPSVTRGGEAA